MNFNADYGSASVAGTYGREDITIAGNPVHNAQLASVTEAYFQQTGVSGIFGLAFSSLTKEYPGNDPSKDTKGEGQNYEPVFYKMVNQKSSLPTFSIAPERNGNNGYLALGGISPVNTTGKTASTPILTMQVKETVPLPAIDRNSYCNATAPKLAFDIGGVNFTISPADIFMQTEYDSEDRNMCALGFQDAANDPPYILGGTFINNVLTTFDLGALEVRFTALAHNNWK
ncbi:aspartic peptidase domain-containing protein [Penicillium lividum]|nr:aspartic peptidase domain-containing protein [Penicillium lividum]